MNRNFNIEQFLDLSGYATDEWKQIHNEVLIRDNFTCQCCNRTQQEIGLSFQNKIIIV